MRSGPCPGCRRQHPVEGADAVGGDDDEPVAEVVHVADLAAAAREPRHLTLQQRFGRHGLCSRSANGTATTGYHTVGTARKTALTRTGGRSGIVSGHPARTPAHTSGSNPDPGTAAAALVRTAGREPSANLFDSGHLRDGRTRSGVGRRLPDLAHFANALLWAVAAAPSESCVRPPDRFGPRPLGITPADRAAFAWYGQRVCDRLAPPDPVSLAFIDGPCLGAGLELALACDHRLVRRKPTTHLGFPELAPAASVRTGPGCRALGPAAGGDSSLGSPVRRSEAIPSGWSIRLLRAPGEDRDCGRSSTASNGTPARRSGTRTVPLPPSGARSRRATRAASCRGSAPSPARFRPWSASSATTIRMPAPWPTPCCGAAGPWFSVRRRGVRRDCRGPGPAGSLLR